MRLIAAFFTLLMLAATIVAGVELSEGLAAPTPHAAPTEVRVASADANTAAPVTGRSVAWPALFGEPEPPKPPAPPVQAAVAEPQPPAPPKPPLSSLGYQLKGVVRAGSSVWGLVSHPTGDQIMRVGDSLSDGMVIARIDEAGLWVDTGADEAELLGYPE